MTGFFVGFFSSYVICDLYLSNQIHGDAAEHKDQVLHHRLMFLFNFLYKQLCVPLFDFCSNHCTNENYKKNALRILLSNPLSTSASPLYTVV